MPNYKYVPIGYHGRASSIRPPAQRCAGRTASASPRTKPSRASGRAATSTIELELGVWIGPGNELGQPIPIADAANHIAGFCLLNDWSARDIQGWEYQPLGPFLGKSFFTTHLAVGRHARSAGAVPDRAGETAGGRSGAAALSVRCIGPGGGGARHRPRGVPAHAGPAREGPAAAPALRRQCPPSLLDRRAARRPSHLQRLQPAARATSSAPARSPARPGDSLGSLLEISAGGRQPITLASGETRRFLEDGDTVIMRAHCRREGFAEHRLRRVPRHDRRRGVVSPYAHVSRRTPACGSRCSRADAHAAARSGRRTPYAPTSERGHLSTNRRP